MKTLKSDTSVLAYSLLVCSCLLFVGCSEQKGPPKQTTEAARKTVTFATSKNAWCALGLVAKNRRFFEEEGLDVNISIQAAGRYCMDALVSKSANFGTVVEVNVAYIGFSGNRDVSVVASAVESVSFAVVGRKSRGILEPKDLRGKSLAFSPGTGGELFAYHFLDHNGIDRKDVQIRKIQPLALEGAIGSKDVDAVATWEPFFLNCLKALGPDGIALRDPEAYRGYMFVGVRRDWASANPAAVEGFLRALKKAQRFIEQNPSDAQAIIAKEASLDLETVEAIWADFKFELSMDKPRLEKDTTAVAKTIKETQKDFADKPVPDYADYFDPGYLKQLQQPAPAK